MAIDNDNEAFIAKAREAIVRAQQETDSLSLSVPSPLRDSFFNIIISRLLKEDHHAEHCQMCVAAALSMALSALSWEDRNAPRPATATERMAALTEQITIALRYLDKLESTGLHGE